MPRDIVADSEDWINEEPEILPWPIVKTHKRRFAFALAFCVLFLVTVKFAFGAKSLNSLYVAVLLGGIWESWRITKYLDALSVFMVASIICMIPGLAVVAFFGPGDDELRRALFIAFCVFLFLVITFGIKNVRSYFNPAITMVHSILFLYWFTHAFATFEYFWIAVALFSFPPIYCFYLAFRESELSNKARTVLSIWTAAVMLVLGTKYVLTIIDGPSSQFFASSLKANYIFDHLDYFFLGAASPYIAYNVLLVFTKELSSEHLKRYCQKPVSKIQTIALLLLCAGIIGINETLKIVEPAFVVCLILIITSAISDLQSGKLKKYT